MIDEVKAKAAKVAKLRQWSLVTLGNRIANDGRYFRRLFNPASTFNAKLKLVNDRLDAELARLGDTPDERS